MESEFGDFEIDYSQPPTINYDLNTLASFLAEDKETTTIVFYGGEPLLESRKMIEIMDRMKAERFMIQTNGVLLDKLPSDYVNRLDTILVSIDGDEVLTDYNRGKGVYRKLMKNLGLLLEKGFSGEIIARMTVTEETEIEKQVLWLLFNDVFRFRSIHWQIDALFGKKDFESRPFARWAEKSYNPQIQSLVKFWVDYMELRGEVLRLYPFLGIMRSMLRNESTLLRCGAGWKMFNIQTNGIITPCPVMAGIKDFYLGHISTTSPLRIRKVFVSEPCPSCDIYNLCGGRCLYANVTKLWGEEGFRLVCKTVKNLIEALEKAKPIVQRLIQEGKISLKHFEYPLYNSCEIIP
jgi:putative peptide-modifying radical SAM enzyme